MSSFFLLAFLSASVRISNQLGQVIEDDFQTLLTTPPLFKYQTQYFDDTSSKTKDELLHYSNHHLDSPYQIINQRKDRFNLEGLIWNKVSNDQNNLIRNYRAVVSLSMHYESPFGDEILFRCTAWYFNYRYLLTAANCVEPCMCRYISDGSEKQVSCSNSRCIQDGIRYYSKAFFVCSGDVFCGHTSYRRKRVTVVNRTPEIAVLEVTDPTFKASNFIKLMSIEDMKKMNGTQVIVIGYPSIPKFYKNINTADKKSVSFDVIRRIYTGSINGIKAISIGNVTIDSTNSADIFRHNALTWGGSNGGPCIIVGNEEYAAFIHVRNDDVSNFMVSINDKIIAKYAPN